LSLIGVISVASTITALTLFGHFFQAHNNPVEGRSIVFASFALNSMVYIFAYRSMRQPLHKMQPLSQNQPLIWAVAAGILMVVLPFLVPALRELLGIQPLTLGEWGIVTGVAIGLLLIVEFGKRISNIYHNRSAARKASREQAFNLTR
jgi:Ca2+-transporting ATPase